MRKGFSLVELSIVLVILGLLTGGILAGQSLIRAAELRAIPAEYARYVASVQTFRDKYMGIPGDIPSATRFWGRAAATADCVTNSAAAVATPGACDGNGNGALNIAAAASTSSEEFQIWKQLALAGLIEGSYSGQTGPNSCCTGPAYTNAIIGTNVPDSKMTNAGWSVRSSSFASVGDTTSFGGLILNNYLIFGAATSTGNLWTAILKPEEAWSVDTKLDDGRPGYGKVVVLHWDTCTLASSNTDIAAAYDLASTAAGCSFYFPSAF